MLGAEPSGESRSPATLDLNFNIVSFDKFAIDFRENTFGVEGSKGRENDARAAGAFEAKNRVRTRALQIPRGTRPYRARRESYDGTNVRAVVRAVLTFFSLRTEKNRANDPR